MKLTYLLIALGLLVAVAYARPVEEEEPVEGRYSFHSSPLYYGHLLNLNHKNYHRTHD